MNTEDWQGKDLIRAAGKPLRQGARRGLTADDYRRCHAEGMTANETAKRLGVSRPTVTAAADRLGFRWPDQQ